MRLRHLYLLIAAFGLVLPLYILTPWTNQHGFNLSMMWDLLRANEVALTVSTDLGLAALAGTIFMIGDGIRSKISFWWVCLIGTFTIGFCFGLPLYLFLRDRAMEQRGAQAA